MGDVDRIKSGLITLVRSVFPRIDYLAHYPARVISQASDGTLDIRPDDPRMAEHQGVPIRYGVPGVTAKVSPGARCHLGFSAGDPTKPYAELWESGTLIELKIAGGSDAVIKGNTFLNALANAPLGADPLTAIATFLNGIAAGPLTGANATAAHAAYLAIQSFQSALSSYLSTIVKTG